MLSRGDLRDIQGACAIGVQQAAPVLAQALEMALVQEMLRRQATLEEQLATKARVAEMLACDLDQALAAQRLALLGQAAAEPHLVALEALAKDGGAWCAGGQDHILGQAVATIRHLRAAARHAPVPTAPVVAPPLAPAAPAQPPAEEPRWSADRVRLLEAQYPKMPPATLLRELNYLRGPKLDWKQVSARAELVGLVRDTGQKDAQPRREGLDVTAQLKREARELFAAGHDARFVDQELECGLNAAAAWLAEWRAEQQAARTHGRSA